VIVPLEFLTLDDVLRIHQRLIDEFGGSAGVRDMGLLQSALAMPGASFGGQYLHDSVAAMAAAYLYHLVQNHPFIDGNKRIGATAARAFILIDDWRFQPPEQKYQDIVLAVASGKLDKAAVTAFFNKYVKK
jgi:death-on-curing protein